MSLVFGIPNIVIRPETALSFNNHTLDATADDLGFVFQMPEDATITTVGWRQGTLTGTPGTLRVGIQGVGAAGLNDGTYLASGNGYVDITSWSSGNDGLFVTGTLGSSVTLTRGQLVCLYFKPQATGTWDASNKVTITTWATGNQRRFNLPYAIQNGVLQTSFDDEVFMLRSSSKTYGQPWQNLTSATINSTTTPDEIGMAFTLPSTWGSTYTIRGARIGVNLGTSNAQFEMRLYNGTTLLQNVAIDTDQVYRFSQNTYEFFFNESTLSTLDYGSEYIVSLQCTNANNIQPVYTVFPTDTDKSAVSNATLKYVSRTDAGSWSETTGRLPAFEILLDSTSVAAGGLLTHPGTAGGMRG